MCEKKFLKLFSYLHDIEDNSDTTRDEHNRWIKYKLHRGDSLSGSVDLKINVKKIWEKVQNDPV